MGLVATLEIMSGDRTGLRHAVPPGGSVRIGRVLPAELIISDDPLLSGLHFAVECGAEGCRVKDLGSRFGTFRRGERVYDADLRDGDEILAGRSRFGVIVADDGLATPAPLIVAAREAPIDRTPAPSLAVPAISKPTHRHKAVREYLASIDEPLFAVLDSAREPTIPERLAKAGAEYQSLFEGDRGKELAPFGPWLVRVPRWSDLLDELVSEGWGNSWGVYLTSKLLFAEVRKHLRRFLEVKLPDGRAVYFRYYDPRVIRTYLQTCTAKEVSEFLGPFDRYLAESADVASVLEFAPSYKDWRKVGVGS